ncbi:MAG: glycosyltransferase family 2 protein [Planctomycetota bacterium]
MTNTPEHPEASATPRDPLRISVAIVNYNGGDRLLNTVEALVNQPYPLVEIIVVDNQSTDDAPQRVKERFPQATIHDMGGNPGPAPARAAGIRAATGDFVLLLDNDVYVEEKTIEHLVEAYHRHGEPTVVCPRVQLVPETHLVQAEGADTHFLTMMVLRHAFAETTALNNEPAEVNGAISAGLLVHRERTLEAGSFDELFSIYQEDLEFSIRLRLLGHRFVCEPKAVVHHDRGTLVGQTFRGDREKSKYPARRGYLVMRHRLLCVFIHNRLRTLLVLSPVLLLYEFASLGIALLRGFGWQYFRAWGFVWSNRKAIAERRRRMQRERVLRDRDLLIGGPIPLTPGFMKNKIAGAMITALSGIMNGYWFLARKAIA